MKDSPTPDNTPRHPIAVVVERTGLSQDILRIWERRYRAVVPGRSTDGKRLYSDRDVERLGLISSASAAGRSVGNVARLTTEELRKLVEEDKAARARAPRVSEAAAAKAGEASGTIDSLAHDVVQNALALVKAMDAAQLDEVLRRAESTMGVLVFLDKVAVPLLHVVGDEWHAGRLTPSQEHLASTMLYDMVVQTMRRFGRRNAESRVVVGTPAGDRHAIGAAIIGTIAAVEGWEVVHIGTDLPASEIAAAATRTNARAVALSVVFVDDAARVLGEFRALRTRLPRAVEIIAGGGGVSHIREELAAAGIRVELTISDWIAELRRPRKSPSATGSS